MQLRYFLRVFFYFSRGYGNSEGVPSEAGLELDGIAAVDTLMERPDIDSSKLILFGYVKSHFFCLCVVLHAAFFNY